MQPDDLTFPAYRAMLANARAQGLEITKPSMERLEHARQEGLRLALTRRHIPIFVEDLFLKVGPHRAAIVEQGWIVPMVTGGYEVRSNIDRVFLALCKVEYERVSRALQRMPAEFDALQETWRILAEELGVPLHPGVEEE